MTVLGVLAFFAAKLVAYTAWCRLGLGLLAAERPASPLRRAGTLAVVRLAPRHEQCRRPDVRHQAIDVADRERRVREVELLVDAERA
ncbi:MAG TPA: hypothetical protein PKA62_04435, partial [Thermoanaerobaculia bacterium]|nr:hypothetical protein [Thermoanaerobaculia bacterium]